MWWEGKRLSEREKDTALISLGGPSICLYLNGNGAHHWSWSSNILTTWYKELTHWKRPWCWERLKAGGEADDRGWDGWMASWTRWTWVWASSGSWWWAGMLQSMGSQKVRHNWVTELNWRYSRFNILRNCQTVLQITWTIISHFH